MLTTKTAIRLAKELEMPELTKALEGAADANAEFVEVVPDGDDLIVQQPSGVMVGWFLPQNDYDPSLYVEGGTPDHHITLAYLGLAAELNQEQQRILIGTVSEVAQRHSAAIGTIQGTGTFDASEGEPVPWWAGVNIPDLDQIRQDLVDALVGAGLPVSLEHEPWQPHVTLAYLEPGQAVPEVSVAPFRVVVDCLTVAIGGYRFDLPLQPIDWLAMEPETDEERAATHPVTPYVPILKGMQQDVDPVTGKPWQYTLGPVYIPGQVDAHGDSIDGPDLESAIHQYVQTGDRRIRLQHQPDIVAGEWVGLLVWPWPVTVPVTDPDTGSVMQRTFPAGTPFMGVKWLDWAWDLIQQGLLRGYSLGGFADFDTPEGEAEPVEGEESAA